MRKIILLIALLCVGFTLHAQKVNISTLTVDYGTWVPEKPGSEDGEWIMTPPAQYVTLFKISKTTIKHITDDGKSTYFVDEDTYYIDKTKHWTQMDITSDTGLNYFVIIDDNKQNLRFYFSEDDNVIRLIRFTYKKVWKEKND